MNDDTVHDSTFVNEVLEDIFSRWNIRDEIIIVKSDNAPTQYKNKNAFFTCKAKQIDLMWLLSNAIVCSPLFLQGGWTSNQILKKRGLNRTSTFRGGLLGKTGVTFFRGGCNFHMKNKLKSKIFNDKKVYKQKYFSLS